jgi:hypothetical protein
MARRKKVPERRVYDVMVSIDVGSIELDELGGSDLAAIEEALVLGFIRPTRFKTRDGARLVAAYEVTPEGREFFHRVSDEYEREHGG